MSTDTFSLFFALLTVLADLGVVMALALWLARKRFAAADRLATRIVSMVRPSALGLAFAVALVSTLGSLYYSQIAHFTPCVLCWYERIAMYPLVLILGIAAVKKDFWVRRYVIPFALLGAALTIYHYQLERFPNQASCDPNVPCSFVWVWKFHFISLPFMGISAFLLITVLMLILPRRNADDGTTQPRDERSFERSRS